DSNCDICFLDFSAAPINPSLFCSATLFSGVFSDEFHNSLNCVRVRRKFNKVPSVHWHIVLYHLQKFMRTDMSENCRRCGMKSLPVNEIYAVCSSKVNSRNNEPTNTISFWANFRIYENVTNALLADFSNLIFLGCDGRVVNTEVFNGCNSQALIQTSSTNPMDYLLT
ncbi:hypothetical protein AVEN_158013-1, partial [Araneus ventricosus]